MRVSSSFLYSHTPGWFLLRKSAIHLQERSKEIALYNLLVSSAMLLKQGEKFFRLPLSIARLRRRLTKGGSLLS